jgi:hypothetical protein
MQTGTATQGLLANFLQDILADTTRTVQAVQQMQDAVGAQVQLPMDAQRPQCKLDVSTSVANGTIALQRGQLARSLQIATLA